MAEHARRVDLPDRCYDKSLRGECSLGGKLAAAAGTGYQQRPLRQPDRRGIGFRAHIKKFLEHERLHSEAALRPIYEQHRQVEAAIDQLLAQQRAFAVDDVQHDFGVISAHPRKQREPQKVLPAERESN